ncbi:MAG: tetratricopeptide repeat protein [Nannocystaceae bacterium]|nr:tetratricopeptide repeat protein [Nannocystaceae bacterium]
MWAALEEEFDSRVEAWAVQRLDACEATHVRGEQSEAALDLRMRCLDRRAVEVEALLATFDTIEPQRVPLALAPLERLPAIEVCADIEFLELSRPTPEAEDEREAVAQLRERASRLSAASISSNIADHEVAAHALVDDAIELGYEPFIAEAKLTRAKIESFLGRGKVAGKLYEEAFEYALATQHLEIQVWAAVEATFVYAEQVRDQDQAERWGRQAQALLRLRAPPHFPRARRALQANLGVAALWAGKLDEARAYLTESARLCEEAGLGDSMDAIGVEANLGILERRSGHLDVAARHLAKAKAKAMRALGEGHPRVGSITNSLGFTYLAMERLKDAETQFRGSLQLLERKVGTNPSSIGHPLNNLGYVLLEDGRADEALPLLTRCIEIWTEQHGVDYPVLADPLTTRGAAFLALDRGEEAKADLERARRLLPETASPNDRGRLLVLLAQAFATTDPARATAFIEDGRKLKGIKPKLKRELAAWTGAEP